MMTTTTRTTATALAKRITDCLRAGDYERLAQLYRPDALLDANVPSWRYQLQGPKAILAQFREELIDQKRHARLKALIQQGWTPELFAEYWSAPDISYIPSMITEDVVGYWPGSVVRGPEAYTKALAELLELLPDLRLEVPEYAVNGDIAFVGWIMHATGPNGPFQMTGVDRVRTREGLVCENMIVFDSAEFQRHLSGS